MQRSNLKITWNLIKLVKPLTPWMILAVSLGLIGHLMATFLSVMAIMALLNILNLQNAISFQLAFTMMLAFGILRGVLRYGEQASNHYIAFKLLALIRSQVFKVLRKLAPAKLEGKDRGDLISVITSDIELLEVFYAHTISPIIIALLMAICMVGLIGSINVTLGFVALVAYVLVGVVVPMVISKISGDDGVNYRQKSGQLSGVVLENIYGIDEIMQYDYAPKRAELMHQVIDDMDESERSLKKTIGKNNVITNSVIITLNVLMIVVGSYLMQANSLSFAGLLIAFSALVSSYGPFISLANLGTGLQYTLACANRVLDIMEELPQVSEVIEQPLVTFGDITVNNLSFAYDSETILDDVSFDLKANKIYGIHGKSGSGKSTLLKLIMRFWNFDDQKIQINNRCVNAINTNDLRSMQAYMTQDAHLFKDTIENNLRIAKLDATFEEIRLACQKAAIDDFIMSLKDGYQTPVAELGTSLSGGEKQRIALARSFLNDAPCLILDEPTSNLDALNEAIILKSIKDASKHKTVLLVSHRLSSLNISDVKLSMNNGRNS